MAKYNVTFSCGHQERRELFGKMQGRYSTIEYWENYGICSQCWLAEQNANCDEVEMPYSEYKNRYASCRTKPKTYDCRTHLITVYVPKEKEKF